MSLCTRGRLNLYANIIERSRWHKADIPGAPRFVRYWSKSGHWLTYLQMSQAKDAADKPCGNGPARTCEKSYASPDNNQFKIDLRRHLIFPFRVSAIAAVPPLLEIRHHVADFQIPPALSAIGVTADMYMYERRL